MRLVIDGFERAIEVESGKVTTVQLENPALFARIVSSLAALDGDFALERYSIWEGEKRLRAKDSLLPVTDLVNLPFDHRLLMSSIVKKMEKEIIDDEGLRLGLEAISLELSEKMLLLGLGYDSDYGYATEWDIKRYLKMMSFGVDISADDSFFDKLLKFISLVFDAGLKQTLVFVNLKTFLTKIELEELFEYVFCRGLRVLLLENKCDNNNYEYEQKYTVDQHFLEF